MPKDLRSFLDDLRKHAPEELVTVTREVRPADFEVNTLLEEFEALGKYPLLLLEHVRSLQGEPWPGRMVSQADPGTFRRAALALGLPMNGTRCQEVIDRLSAAIERPIPPVVVPRREAPVQEVVTTGGAVDLATLPLLMHHEKDTRPGWFTPIMAAAHPETGRYNLSYHRNLYKGRSRVTSKISSRHLYEYLQLAAERGQSVPVAMVVGHHPGFYLASAMRAPWTVDEYGAAGGTLGEPLRVVPSASFGERLLVPADAEVVVEGEILPTVKDLEGPFGEWPHYYGPQTKQPVIECTAITRRRDAIFQAIWTSHHIIEDISHAAAVHAHLKTRFPRVLATSSLYHTWIITAIDKRSEGEPERVGALALGYGDHVKLVVVVDKDIDPFNLRQVFWAIAVRAQPDQAVQILRHFKSNPLDPSTVRPTLGSVMIVDATEPVDRPFEEVVAVPQAVKVRIHSRLEEYVPRDVLNQVPTRDPWQL